MAVEVGVGYVSVVPEVQGFGQRLQQEVTGPADAAGQGAGGAAGEGFKSKMGGVLKAGIAGIGVAAGAVLVKGFQNALDQQSINNRIQAQLGSTPKDAKRYGDVAGQLYAHGVTDNVQDAANVIRSVLESGIAPPDATNHQLESIASKAGNLAKVFDQDVGGVTRAVSQMLRTGMAKSADEAFDVLTRGFQNGSNKADDLLDTMNEYSTQFRKLGLDGKTSLGLISQMVQAGARDSDVAADALKEFSIRVVDGSKTTADGFKAIGLNAEDMAARFGKGGETAAGALDLTIDRLRAMKDPVEQNQAAVNLFGTQSEDLGKALYAMDPSNAVKALGKTAGAADKMGKALHSGAGARIEQFKRTAEVKLTNFIGNQVLPPMLSLGSAAADVVAPAFNRAKGVVGGFFGSFSSGGVRGVISGIGQEVRGLASSARDELSPSVGALSERFTTSFLPAARGVWAVISTQLAPSVRGLFSAVSGAVGPAFTGLAQIFTGTVVPAAISVYTALYENVQPILSSVADFISAHVVPAVRSFGAKFQEVVQKAQPLIQAVSTVAGWVGRLAAEILGAAIPVIVRLAGPVFSGLVWALGVVLSGIGDVIWIVGKLAQAFVGAIRGVGEFASSSKRRVGDFVDWMGGLPRSIRRKLGDFRELLVGKGRDLVRGIWDGVRELGGWLKDKLTGWAKKIIPGPIAKALGINSPSRLMRDEIGRWIPAGVVEGIDAEQRTLDTRLRAMVRVPEMRAVRASAAGVQSQPTGSWEGAINALLRSLERERGRDIVVRIGETEIARAVAYGQRQLARR
ncbi:phage tail tape measure protein [Streptomyces spectabilis]|uniref:Phage-related protein n=1 Tax=Streptomyces spectabilis TaxID=68270 RepID=A0A5P2X805_STRST|nr:phage tail tape measure protein [Streptomyces spectabilis]MBB5103330.1 phage-related protein [Streptomyces spectabilis]MCI3902520.1 phage tail tape measure protein [Streptomyces spectabilis]QEV59854.1 hypothetical protein CP982_14825 [Streptomyces spectabilis]GGV54223.1 hypothetical protein GCM10010245_85670 [Streptomyces spectabilis]